MPGWDISGSWAGQFSYDSNDAMPTLPPAVKFTLEARSGWFGSFRGAVQDDLSAGVPEEATIKGRVSGTRVTFRKWYPRLYVVRGGKSVTIRDFHEAHGVDPPTNDPSPPPVRYRGEYDPAEGVVRGTWRIERGVILLRFGWRSSGMAWGPVTGSWQMRRELQP